MLRRAFNYDGRTNINLETDGQLLERIFENLEDRVEDFSDECSIKITHSESPIEIVKDKRFEYMTLNTKRNKNVISTQYFRYNTPVRTIFKEGPGKYDIFANTFLDEQAGLICIRDHITDPLIISDRELIHASLVELNGKGILLSGNRRQGKSTLMVYLLQESNAKLIGDENIILDSSGDRLKGIYLPLSPSVRFSTIYNSNLANVLNDVSLTRATQYIDREAIERIIKTKSYGVDAGLSFSRMTLCELLGTSSKESAFIDLVVFPRYEEGNISIRKIPPSKGLRRLGEQGLVRKNKMEAKQFERCDLHLKPENYLKTKFIEIAYSGMDALIKEKVQL